MAQGLYVGAKREAAGGKGVQRDSPSVLEAVPSRLPSYAYRRYTGRPRGGRSRGFPKELSESKGMGVRNTPVETTVVG